MGHKTGTGGNRECALRKEFIWGMLLLLLLFHAVNNYLVLRQDTVYFQGDPADLYLRTVWFLQHIRTDSLLGNVKALYRGTSDIYPPLVIGVTALFLKIFGISQDTAVMANIPFLAVLLISTYLLGKELFNGETGLVAATLLSFFPSIFSASRAYLLELPLTALLTLTLYFLVRSRHLTRPRESLLFGMGLALAAITKPTVSLYATGPILVLVVPHLLLGMRARDTAAVKNIIRHILLAGIPVLLIASPWYIYQSGAYFSDQHLHLSGPNMANQQTISLGHLLGGYVTLLQAMLLTPLAWLFGISLLSLGLEHRSHLLMFLCWVIPPYIFWVMIRFPEPQLLRQLLPTLPAVALVTAVFLWRTLCLASRSASNLIRRGSTHAATVGILLLLCIELLFFLKITYSQESVLGVPALVDMRSDHEVADSLNYFGRPSPHHMGFEIDEVMKVLEEEWSARGTIPSVFFLNRFGIVSDALHTEMVARSYQEGDDAAAEDIFTINVSSFNLLQCLSFDEEGGNRTEWLEPSRCIELFDSADYAVIEDVSRHDWWLWDEEMYAEGVVPVVRHIEKSAADYSVLFVLPNALDKYPPQGQFGWLNNSAWVLKKRKS